MKIRLTALRIVGVNEDGDEVFVDVPKLHGELVIEPSSSEPSAFGANVISHGSNYVPAKLHFPLPLIVDREDVTYKEYTVRGAVGDVPSELFDELRPHHDAVKRR